MLTQNQTSEIYNNSLNKIQNARQREIKSEPQESAYRGSISCSGTDLTKQSMTERFGIPPTELRSHSFRDANPLSTDQDADEVSIDTGEHDLLGQRAEREFVPSDKKDSMYWSKRIKNNNSARRSRMKRRTNEQDVVEKLKTLQQENIELKYELQSLNRIFAKQIVAANVSELPNVESTKPKYLNESSNGEYLTRKYDSVPSNDEHANRKYETVHPDNNYGNRKFENASLSTNEKYETVSPNLDSPSMSKSELQTSTWYSQPETTLEKVVGDYTPRQNIFQENTRTVADNSSYLDNLSRDVERVSNDQVNGNSHTPYGMTYYQTSGVTNASLTGFYSESAQTATKPRNNSQQPEVSSEDHSTTPIIVNVFSLQNDADGSASFSDSLDFKQGIQSVPHKYRHKRGFHSAFSKQ